MYCVFAKHPRATRSWEGDLIDLKLAGPIKISFWQACIFHNFVKNWNVLPKRGPLAGMQIHKYPFCKNLMNCIPKPIQDNIIILKKRSCVETNNTIYH